MNNIEAFFRDTILILKGVPPEEAPRKIVAHLAANGTGKTSILKAISLYKG